MLAKIAGFAFGIIVAFDAYKIFKNVNESVENKFKIIYAEYLQLKKQAESNIEQANKAREEKNRELFKFHLENISDNMHDMLDKLRSIERNLRFIADGVPIYSKILSIVSLFGNAFICLNSFFDSYSQQSSLFTSFSRLLASSVIIYVGILGVYYSHNIKVIDENIALVQSEINEVEKKFKNEINFLKTNYY